MTGQAQAAFDPIERLTAYHKAINALDFAVIEAMFAEDAIYVSGGVGGTIEGRDAIMAAFRTYFGVYPDQVAADSLVEASGDNAARSIWTLKAKDSRTGEPMVRTGEETVTFNDDGRIVRVNVTDYSAPSATFQP